MRFLTFTLAAPLSSYGETGRWDHRGTADMPTKSSVIGLLGCCMGLHRGDDGLRRLDEALHMAVREDRAGALAEDYQTVQSPGGAILNAMRKPRGSTIVTPKQYLQDAVFQVFLYGDEPALAACAAAMKRPRWVASLGRRCCPPAVPLLPEFFEADSVAAALGTYVDTAWTRLMRAKQRRALENAAADDPRGARRKRKRAAGEAGSAGSAFGEQGSARCEIEYSEALALGGLPGAYRINRQDAVVRADENRYENRQVVACVIRRGVECT